MFEARIAGVGFFDVWNYTWGELIEYIQIFNERERRKYKNESIIAFRQAELTASWIWKHTDMNVADAFPYWSEEEKKQTRLEKYKQIMWKHVSSTHIEKR
ncbi:MAG: hypothetical protein K2I03_08405 [Lachnospiraceae bacterium]|nr:hypothetical protein [Lachnospiraceae bacterium]